MEKHELKIKSEYFVEILQNRKFFELRRNDRNYQINDSLILCEIDDDGNKTGSYIVAKVMGILDKYEDVIKEGYVILSIRKEKSITVDDLKYISGQMTIDEYIK